MNIDEKILNLFRQMSAGFLSGEEISKRIGVSRTAVWKHIEGLREVGYKIEAQPHLGYRLLGVPDKLLPDEIRHNLDTKILGKEIYSYEKVDSTNDIAYGLAEEGKGEGVIVLAEEQTKGKGRLGRKWVSPALCGIYLSCILRPRILPNEVSKITLVAATSVAKAIRRFTDLEAMIKWPNDILLSGKKVCGILTEMKAEPDKVDFLILGIGINVNTSRRMLPVGATSIKEESKNAVSRLGFLKTLLQFLESTYEVFNKEGFEPVRREFRNLSATLGKRVRVISHDRTLEGQAQDVDERGALVLRLDSGLSEHILSGDVVLVR